MAEAIFSLYLDAMVLGRISPKIMILSVIIAVATPIPLDPSMLIAKAVARLDAQLFTMLFPIKIVVNSFEGSDSNLINVLEEVVLDFLSRLNCILEREVQAVSEAEKKAEEQSNKNKLRNNIKILFIYIPQEVLQGRFQFYYCEFQ